MAKKALRKSQTGLWILISFFVIVLSLSLMVVNLQRREVFRTSPKASIPPPEVFNVIEDAYVSKTYPGKNFGKSTSLIVSEDPVNISYLKFDLTSLVGVKIAEAKLRVYITDPIDNPTGGVQVRKVDDLSWSESTINYNNRPALGEYVPVGIFSSALAGTWAEVDVTRVAGENIGRLLSLGVEAHSWEPLVGDLFTFNSKENSVNRPHLLIISDGVPPTVKINQPKDGGTVSGAVDIKAVASDDNEVRLVEFWFCDMRYSSCDAAGYFEYIGYDSSVPYSQVWNTTNSGNYKIMVVASDIARNRTSAVIDVVVDNTSL